MLNKSVTMNDSWMPVFIKFAFFFLPQLILFNFIFLSINTFPPSSITIIFCIFSFRQLSLNQLFSNSCLSLSLSSHTLQTVKPLQRKITSISSKFCVGKLVIDSSPHLLGIADFISRWLASSSFFTHPTFFFFRRFLINKRHPPENSLFFPDQEGRTLSDQIHVPR